MRSEKKQMAADLRKRIEPSAGLFLVSYKGLKVSEFMALRGILAGLGAECHVVPNRVLLRAASEAELQALANYDLRGDSALISGGTDAVAVAKALKNYAKENPKMAFKIGFLEGKAITSEEIVALAELPPIDIMRAQLLGLMQAVPTRLVSVLNAKVASVLYALQAYLDTKQEPK